MEQDIGKTFEVLNQQVKELAAIYHQAVSRYVISDNEFWVWYALLLVDADLSQQNICEMWSLPKQTVNSVISGMVKKGYVELEAIPGTKNKKIMMILKEYKIFHPGLFCQIRPELRDKLQRVKCLFQIHVILVVFIVRERRISLNPIHVFRTNCPRLAIPFLTIRSPMHEKTEFQILPLFQFHLYRRVLLLIIFHTFVLGL